MKGGLEFAGREQESVYAPQALRFDIDEEARAAFATGDAGIALEFPSRRVAADHVDRSGGIDRFRHIGSPVHGLTVVAMAENCTIGSPVISTSTAPQRHWTFVIRSAPSVLRSAAVLFQFSA
jgi:hypothetical protein